MIRPFLHHALHRALHHACGPIALALATFALADTAAAYTADGGQSYRGSCNANGFVLRAPHEVIYLGRSCDAYSPTLGHGTWCYYNGGMWAKLGTHTRSFQRQEPMCGDKPALLPCLCH